LGGLGHQARALHSLLGTECFDVIDISDFAVKTGNANAHRDGLDISFRVMDLNREALPENHYDLIVANGALHHIENLEHLFEQINLSLTPGGLFFANDYMGPNHMQWTENQISLMNALLACFPDHYNQVLHKENKVIKEITRIPLEIFQKVDPSEGVRASDIFEVMGQYLRIVKTAPICQTLLYELMRGRVHNFDESNETDCFVLNLLCLFEQTLFDNGVIGSDFNLVFAERGKGPT